jgi:hypothetical protein
MPTSAYGLLILGLFGIAWLIITWRSLLIYMRLLRTTLC